MGILTFGVVSEQVKTRLEEGAERRDTKVPPSHLVHAMDTQEVKAPLSSSSWCPVLSKDPAIPVVVCTGREGGERIYHQEWLEDR